MPAGTHRDPLVVGAPILAAVSVGALIDGYLVGRFFHGDRSFECVWLCALVPSFVGFVVACVRPSTLLVTLPMALSASLWALAKLQTEFIRAYVCGPSAGDLDRRGKPFLGWSRLPLLIVLALPLLGAGMWLVRERSHRRLESGRDHRPHALYRAREATRCSWLWFGTLTLVGAVILLDALEYGRAAFCWWNP